MKFKIDKDKFLDAISIVGRSVGSNGTLPILSNILLKAEEGKIFFLATDLDLQTSYFIDDIEIEEEGEITIPAKLLQSYLNFLKPGIVDFQTKDEDILLKSKSGKTKIKGLNSKDFPKVAPIKTENNFLINSKILKSAIADVLFSVSTSMSRPFLTGINLNIKGGEVFFMSTDSYRFSQRKIDLDTGLEDVSIIIPAKTAQEVSKTISDWGMIGGEDFDVKINFSEDQILFEIGDIKLSSRLIPGKFPDCTMLIPKEKKLTVVAQRQDFAQLVKRVNIFAKENNNNLKISFSEENQEIEIDTKDTNIGSDESSLEASIKGESMQIALNSEFLIAILGVIKSEDVLIEANGVYSPVVFKEPERERFLHIIMPLRV
ncbi:DNA polymerase III subunit beta [Candidatus Gracilibacteria bacterium]|nr:DNA polymerase III subunit beta [Candidatus Gracilibacteria bacterium]